MTELVKEEFAVIDGPEVLRRWRQAVGDVPGVKTLGFSGAGHGPGGGPAISLTLMGSNIDQVARAAAELERRIRQYEGVYDIRNSFQRGTPEIKLNIKPEAESLGLTLSDLARQVRAGFYGEEVQRIQRGQDEVKVMVRFPVDERDSVGYLDNMRIRTPDGGRVPFHAVAEVEMGEAPLRIQRFDRERAVRVSAEVDKEQYEPEKITADILGIELPEVLQQFPGRPPPPERIQPGPQGDTARPDSGCRLCLVPDLCTDGHSSEILFTTADYHVGDSVWRHRRPGRTLDHRHRSRHDEFLRHHRAGRRGGE